MGGAEGPDLDELFSLEPPAGREGGRGTALGLLCSGISLACKRVSQAGPCIGPVPPFLLFQQSLSPHSIFRLAGLIISTKGMRGFHPLYPTYRCS